MLGTLLKDRYRIDSKLGEGGMGIVYKAHDTVLNRPVAIKSLAPAFLGGEGLKRLLREAQSASQLTHSNIVAVYDILEESQTGFLIMEYVEGTPLAELIPLEVPPSVDVATQVCRALEYAHSRGIVHRDIKPENILVTTAGTAKVTDFGLARSEGRSRLTQSGFIVGTVAYMAPEQVLGGRVDGRSDLYSLGCVIYETLTGRKPFEGDDPFTVISQQVNILPVAPRWHNTAIPHTLDAIVMRLLAKDPDDRYASATDVIRALELVRELAGTVVPEPSEPATRTTLLEHIVRGKLVGRTTEVRELREHLDRVVSGEGRLVLISGEPGIGKTRLAEELAVYAHLRGAWVLRGHCYEQDVGVPYLPFMESLRELFHLSGQALINELGDRADDLAHLLPEFRRTQPQTPALTPEDERIHVFDAVAQWVAAASGLHPLVFLLDDLHWADRASLRLLHHLVRTVRGQRVLVLGTYREMELDLEHPLHDALSQMNRERLFYRLPLRRLSEADTRDLLAGLFDADISRELAGVVYRETEGNPFFIEEVVKALVEESKVYRESGRWRRAGMEELEIPQSVKAVIGRRLQKTNEACRRVLTIAAVIGREFDPDVLMRVSHLEEDTVLDGLDDAVHLQLIRETREGRRASYTFEHALIRQTLYEGLNARRRARLHQEVGEALEALYGTRQDHIEELAYHFGEAGATASKGIEYNLRAAQKAASLYAMEEGERRLGVAMELADAMDDASARVKVLEALGDLYLLFEDRRAIDAYQRALNILKTEGATATEDALRLYCRVAEASAGWWIEAPAGASLYAQTAVDLLKDQPDSPLKARALSVLAMHRARSVDASADAHAHQAIDMAARLGDRHTLSMAYRAMAMVYRYRNEWDRLGEVVQKRRALLESVFTPSDADVYADIVDSYVREGKLSDAEKASREFLEMAEKLRSPTAIYRACAELVEVLFFNNTWDEALQVAERVIVLGDRLHAVGAQSASTLNCSGQILVARTNEDRARERITQMEAMRYDLPPEHQSVLLSAVRVALSLEDRDLVARLLPRLEQEKPRCLSCANLFNVVVAHARLQVGDIEGAQAKLDDAQQLLPEGGSSMLRRGTLAYLRGLIAEVQEKQDMAIKHFEEANRSALRPLNWYSAQHVEAAGKAYLATGNLPDLARGRQLLAEAIDFYRMVGAPRFEARARQLLAAAEDRP